MKGLIRLARLNCWKTLWFRDHVRVETFRAEHRDTEGALRSEVHYSCARRCGWSERTRDAKTVFEEIRRDLLAVGGAAMLHTLGVPPEKAVEVGERIYGIPRVSPGITIKTPLTDEEIERSVKRIDP